MPWWRHQMEIFSALLAFCAGNSPVTGEFPSQRPVTRSFDVFFDLHLNKRLSKQSWGWWFETPTCSLWRRCNAYLWFPEQGCYDQNKGGQHLECIWRAMLDCVFGWSWKYDKTLVKLCKYKHQIGAKMTRWLHKIAGGYWSIIHMLQSICGNESV